MVALGFELLTRRSELIALRNQDITERANGSLGVLIRRSKSGPMPTESDRVDITTRGGPAGEMTFLPQPRNFVLLCPIYQGNVIDRCLETTTERLVIEETARRCGLRAYQVAFFFSGHSMRVGAAQDLLKRGLDKAAITRAGCWKSANVLARYLENAKHNVWA